MADGFYLLYGVKPTGVHSGAVSGRGVPTFLIPKDRTPKRPGSALAWTNGIDLATSGRFQENTVVIGLFRQTHPAYFFAGPAAAKLHIGNFQVLGQGADFDLTDPNTSRCPAAAFAATGTRKAQTLCVPRTQIAPAPAAAPVAKTEDFRAGNFA